MGLVSRCDEDVKVVNFLFWLCKGKAAAMALLGRHQARFDQFLHDFRQVVLGDARRFRQRLRGHGLTLPLKRQIRHGPEGVFGGSSLGQSNS